MNRRFLVVLLGLSFLLSACAFDQMDKGLTALRGEKIQTAFNYLGYPDTEQVIAGSKVYTWGTSYSQTAIMPVTNYTSGNVYGYGGSANYHGTSTSYVPQTYNYLCILKIITDKKGVIINGQYEGNEGGCSDYGSALNKAAKDLTPIAPTSNSNGLP